MEDRETPVVELTGYDGNAFAVMGAVRDAMKAADWTSEEIMEVMDDMMSGDYNHLLRVAMKVCEAI
jgi:uncharacterized alpha/beta hydrolase family protein